MCFPFFINGGLSISRNSLSYTLNGTQKEIAKIGNAVPKAIFVLTSNSQGVKGIFYVPDSVLMDAGLAWSLTIADQEPGIDTVFYCPMNYGVVLPDAPEGLQIVYTDGTNAQSRRSCELPR